MITLSDFKQRCTTDTAENIVDDILLKNYALHVTGADRSFVVERLSTVFRICTSDIKLWVVGSAKLGFSITEKRKNGVILPRYRSFTATSDIDLAIVSPKLFRLLWDELSIYAHGWSWIPWDSGRLGDYMVYGWLRPDYFPSSTRMQNCDAWRDEFRRLSRDSRFGRHSVGGALFYSLEDLQRYQRRSVLECIRVEQEKR